MKINVEDLRLKAGRVNKKITLLIGRKLLESVFLFSKSKWILINKFDNIIISFLKDVSVIVYIMCYVYNIHYVYVYILCNVYKMYTCT